MSPGTKPNDVRELHEQCSAIQKKWNRNLINREKATWVREWTFRGPVFDAFSKRKSTSDDADAELAIKYRLLLKMFRETTLTDARLNIFAQWLWGEFDILPEDSLGVREFTRLSSDVRKKLNKIPLNDLFYAQFVRIWLPYSERLFQDAKKKSRNTHDLKKRLIALGYETDALEIFNNKSWNSTVEFTCEWLATRGEIEMVKHRENSDTAATLRNAYTKIMGRRKTRP
jgi:hypothetical protein